MESASSAAATARAGAGQGYIHFVTPTNRWMGSIPLSTIDPLTLEPLSTYVRPDPPRRRDRKNEVAGEGIVEQEEEDDDGIEEVEDMKERTTNIAGDPISLILARLQTMPQGCACGCTVPDPPKHSDYYHAQHLLRLLFQTQRVRSRSLKMYLPGFFEQFGEEEEDEGDDEEDEGDDEEDEGDDEDEDFMFECGQELGQEMEQGQGQELEQHQAHLQDSVIIPIDANNNLSDSTLALPLPHQNHHHQQQPPPPPPPQSTKRSKKIPRYVHSLVQNRNFRNPLTNTEIEGDATFFVVLEPGKGGWWHEPWAMAMRPAGVQGFHSLLHRQQSRHQSQGHYQKEEQKEQELTEKMKEKESEEGEGEEKKTPEMIQLEKELRKERWRQGRIVNLELEAQHEMDWRRWNRSQATYAAEADMDDNNTFDETGTGGRHSNVRRRRGKRDGRKMMRLKLAKDIALLEPSELGLRLPRRVKKSRSECSDTEKMDRGKKKNNNCITSESLLSFSKEKDVTCTTTIANTNNIGDGLLFRSVQASTVLDNVEMEDIRQQQKQQQEQRLEGTSEKPQQQLTGLQGPHRRITNKCRRRLARAHRTKLFSSSTPSASSAPAGTTSAPSSGRASQAKTPVDFSFLPWWDPDPRPFQMPSTKLSPFAISTLPEPVAKLFGGTSIYSLIPPPNTNTTTKDASTTSVSGATEVETESSTEIPTPAAKIPTKNTAGCQWVPVKRGDRVAVMMGTSKDFLLFPSFQRLLFRHLSREDFEDRVARANRIPCPATAIVVTNTTSGGGEAVQQQMREQGERIRQEVLQRQMLHQRQREERDVSAMEEGDRSVTATAATNTGRGRTWIEWMSPRRRQNNEHRSNSDPTTRTVNTATIGAELGIRLPIPPSSESTTAFVDGSSASNNSSSSSSIGGSSDRSGRSFGEEEDSMRGQAEDEKYSSRADDLGSTPNNNNNVDMMDEKSVAAALDSTLATTNNPSIPTNAVHKATTNDKETREEREQRWLVLEERFLREDYDSSEYSYASSSEDEYDELPLDYDGPYYSSEDSESSDGDDGSDAEDEEDELPGRRRRSSDRDHAATTATARWRWGIRDWIYFFTFCTPHPRTLTATNSNETTGTNRGLASVGGPLESRRARRRRLRREHWQRIQNRQREQESAAFHRYLPTIIRRRMSAQDVHRCCMAAEFCRFYVTILMALALIGAIVYGAVHVEASPPSPPRLSPLPSPDVKDVMTQGGSSGGGGGGSLRKVPPEQWTSSFGMSGVGGEGVLQREESGDGGRQQQQKPLGSVE